MSRRKTYTTLAIVLSLFLTAAFGFSYDTFTVSGKVLKADGTPAAGYQVKVSNESRDMTLDEGVLTTATTDANGEYTVALTGDAVVESGDSFKVEVIDPATGDILGYSSGVVGDANFEFQGFGLKIGSITIDVKLPGITATITPNVLKAGVDTQADVSVTVLDQSGNPITDDTVTLEVLQGGGKIISPATFQDGAYRSTYTAPSPALEGEVKIKITSAKLGKSVTSVLTVLPGPAETVSVEPEMTKLQVPEQGQSVGTDVIITVKDSQGNYVKDETVTVSSIFEGQTTDLGKAENLGDGTYKITFSTTSTKAGIVTIEATTSNGKKGSAEITMTAQAPAVVTLTAQPTEITAGSSETITVTALVEDKAGNPTPDEAVKFELISELSDPGTLSAQETTTDADGKCQVSYTPGTSAGTVKVKATALSTKVYGETEITVKAGSAAELTVQILPETGIVADGSATASVTVTVKDSFGNPVSDEQVKLAVKEGKGSVTEEAAYDESKKAYVGTYTAPVLALKEGEEAQETIVATAQKAGISATATVKLLATPPKTTPVLTITGTVYYADGVTPAPAGWQVKIENLRLGPNDYLTPVEPVETNSDGTYNVVLLALENVAQTGDKLQATVTVSAGGEEIFRGTRTLTSEEIEKTSITWDLVTTKSAPPASTAALTIIGTVYYADGETPASKGWTVKVVNTRLKDEDYLVLQPGVTDESGRYDAIMIAAENVAQTGDTLEVVVTDSEGKEIFKGTKTLSTKVVRDAQVTWNLVTNKTVSTQVFSISGTVYYRDGTIASGWKVKIENKDIEGVSATITSNGTGRYDHVFLEPEKVIARSNDTIEIVVKHPKTGEIDSGHLGTQAHGR